LSEICETRWHLRNAAGVQSNYCRCSNFLGAVSHEHVVHSIVRSRRGYSAVFEVVFRTLAVRCGGRSRKKWVPRADSSVRMLVQSRRKEKEEGGREAVSANIQRSVAADQTPKRSLQVSTKTRSNAKNRPRQVEDAIDTFRHNTNRGVSVPITSGATPSRAQSACRCFVGGGPRCLGFEGAFVAEKTKRVSRRGWDEETVWSKSLDSEAHGTPSCASQDGECDMGLPSAVCCRPCLRSNAGQRNRRERHGPVPIVFGKISRGRQTSRWLVAVKGTVERRGGVWR